MRARDDISSLRYFSDYRAIFPATIITPGRFLARITSIVFFPAKQNITFEEIRLKNAHPSIFLPGFYVKAPPFFWDCAPPSRCSGAPPFPAVSCQSFFSRRYFSGWCFHCAARRSRNGGGESRRQKFPQARNSSRVYVGQYAAVTYAGWPAIVKVTRRVRPRSRSVRCYAGANGPEVCTVGG